VGTLFVAVLMAQETPAVTGEVLRTLGPFSAAVLIGGMWVRDLSQRLRASVAREQLLSDRLVELAERSTPLLVTVADTLPKVIRELERRERRRE
jgi:hypothetical protein